VDDGPYDSASDAPQSDACQTYYGARARAEALAAPCDSFDAGALDGGNLQTLCEQELGGQSCTPADRAIVAELAEGVASCVNTLGACAIGSEASWTAAKGACFHQFLEGDAGAAISSACSAALYVAGL
jgi:hypothetical protein